MREMFCSIVAVRPIIRERRLAKILRISPSELLARRQHYPNTTKENKAMPVLLWALGVPLTIVLALMLFGVVHF
jgi:hypothetical protein